MRAVKQALDPQGLLNPGVLFTSRDTVECHDVGTMSSATPPTSRPLVIAHRGASEHMPEHTLAAYVQAIDDGADGLEADVRLTADGHLVCVHDRRIDRTSNGEGVLSTLELADLESLDFGGWQQAAGAVELPDQVSADHSQVLTLERLLELVVDCAPPGPADGRDQAPDALRRAGRAPSGRDAAPVRPRRLGADRGGPGHRDELQ